MRTQSLHAFCRAKLLTATYHAALEVLHSDAWRPVTGPVPRNLWISERTLMKTLDAIRNCEEAAKWWNK